MQCRRRLGREYPAPGNHRLDTRPPPAPRANELNERWPALSNDLLLLAIGVYATLLIAAVRFTRATPRRVVGTVAAGIAVAVAGVGIEAGMHALGVWRYPGVMTAYGPPLMYPLIV